MRMRQFDLMWRPLLGIALGIVAIILVLEAGCSSSSRVLPVAVVAWPSPIKPKCEIPELPTPPEIVSYESPTSAGLDHYYVTLRQIQDMIQWHADVRHWGDAVTKCLEKLSDQR